jgi:hypothetical protein
MTYAAAAAGNRKSAGDSAPALLYQVKFYRLGGALSDPTALIWLKLFIFCFIVPPFGLAFTTGR